nr:unnamed protein product [Callosobruchus chinensis]
MDTMRDTKETEQQTFKLQEELALPLWNQSQQLEFSFHRIGGCRHADLPSLPAIILIRLLVCGACTSFVVNLTLRRRFSTLTGNPSVNQDNSKY